MSRAICSPVLASRRPPASDPLKPRYDSSTAGEVAITRVMFGTMPSLPFTASNSSLVFPVAVEGSIECKRDIDFSLRGQAFRGQDLYCDHYDYRPFGLDSQFSDKKGIPTE